MSALARRAAVSVLTAVELGDSDAFRRVVADYLAEVGGDAVLAVEALTMALGAMTVDVVLAADDAGEGAARARLLDIRLGASAL